MAKTEHSKNFEKVKDYYNRGLWSKERVYAVIGRWITANEYLEIVGEGTSILAEEKTDA